MANTPHILIIGAGLIGLSTADALMSRGAKVTLIDSRPGPGEGASFANSGMIHPSQARPWDIQGGFSGFDRAGSDAAFKAVYDLAKYSAALLGARMADLELTDRAREPGCYKLYVDVATARRAQVIYRGDEIKSDLIVDDYKTLGRPALYFAEDRSGNAHAYCQALSEHLYNNGVVFIYEAAGLRLHRGKTGVAARLDDHVFRADHVIIAAGAQSAEIAKQVGVSLLMNSLKGYAVNYKRPDMALPEVPIMDAHSRSALTIFGDHVRLSGTVNAESDEALIRRWTELAPQIMTAAGEPLTRWSGLRPMTQSGRPYIGPTSVPRLWINTGHGHMGWTLCAGSGELMADMIMDGKTDHRFAVLR